MKGHHVFVPNLRRVLAALLAAISAVVVSMVWSSPSPVGAAVDIESFLAAPGVVRTDLPASVVEASPDGSVLYAAAFVTGGQRLIALDTETFEPILDAPLGNATITDIAVSFDGSIVRTVSMAGVRSFDAATLTETGRINLDFPDDRRTIEAAPDRNDAFLVVGSALDGGVIVEGDSVEELVNLFGFTSVRDLTYGVDSQTLFGLANGLLARFDVDGTLQADTSVTVRSRSDQIEFSDGVIWVADLVFDTVTLAPIADADLGLPKQSFQNQVHGGVVLRDDNERSLPLYSVYEAGFANQPGVEPLYEFELPMDSVTEVVPMGDDLMAVLERDSVGDTYLTVVGARLLASGFGDFHQLSPARILDTRTQNGVSAPGPLGPDDTIRVQITGRGGVPDSGVLAVTMNVTVTLPTAAGSFFSIWPAGRARPVVSNLNFVAGQSIANFVTVEVGEDGAVELFNRFGDAHAIFDVVGYYSSIDGEVGARYESLPGGRLLDTRSDPRRQPVRPLGPGETIELDVSDLTPTDGNIVAVVVNVTAVGATQGSFLTVSPSGEPRPTASTLNVAPGDTRANMAIVGLGAGQKFSVFNRFGTVDLVVDLVGVYTASTTPRTHQRGRLYPTTPFRGFDSRESSPFEGDGRLGPESALILSNFTGWTDIVNVTATAPSSDGFLAVTGWDDAVGYQRPSTSNVNFRAGETVANGAYATGAPHHAIYNPIGFTHVVVDTFGFLTPAVLRPIGQVWGVDGRLQRGPQPRRSAAVDQSL